MSKRILLSDEQIRQFICDGFLKLQSDLDDTAHRRIDEQLRWANEKEFPMGNNILARVPEMHDVIESPVFAGALASLLGPGYVLHPHRAVHTSTPVEHPQVEHAADVNAPAMGKGSMAGSSWHQDAQSPLSRARHHVPRYVIAFYFPHDTPIEMGPTRLQAGSHLYSRPSSPRAMVLPDFLPSGSIFLLHFDIVHAAFPNRCDRTRYMVKFVFARTEHPRAPSWDNDAIDWHPPRQRITQDDLPNTWSYIWHWMRGDVSRIEAANATITDGGLRHQDEDQATRLEMIYASYTKSAKSAQSDIQAMADALLARAGRGLHERSLAKNAEGKPIPRDAPSRDRRWTERAVVMEDATYALASMGSASVPMLTELLAHDDPWIAINASFALGEIGPAARCAVPEIAALLKHPMQQVVRQALDALGGIGAGLTPALAEIERLMTTSNPDWQAPQVMRAWVGEDHVRLNAAFALLNAVTADGNDVDTIEDILIPALDDPNGYVGAIACEALSRIDSHAALRAALKYLKRHRWDDSLAAGKRIF